MRNYIVSKVVYNCEFAVHINSIDLFLKYILF